MCVHRFLNLFHLNIKRSSSSSSRTSHSIMLAFLIWYVSYFYIKKYMIYRFKSDVVYKRWFRTFLKIWHVYIPAPGVWCVNCTQCVSNSSLRSDSISPLYYLNLLCIHVIYKTCFRKLTIKYTVWFWRNNIVSKTFWLWSPSTYSILVT
jgi:hypothetical protein